jgi:hypothetical protein
MPQRSQDLVSVEPAGTGFAGRHRTTPLRAGC